MANGDSSWYDNTLYSDPGGGWPPEVPPDLGVAGSDSANPPDASWIGSIDGNESNDPFAGFVPDIQGNFEGVQGNVQELSDGSVLYTNNDGFGSLTTADGATYENVEELGQGVLRFSDGTVLDSSTGVLYQSLEAYGSSPQSSTGTQNNGAGKIKPTPLSSGGTGGPGMAIKPGGQSGQAKPLDANALSAALSKFGAGLASLFAGQAKTASPKQTVSSVGAVPLGGLTGVTVALVLGGLVLIIALTQRSA